jgi:microcystin-dependent protein
MSQAYIGEIRAYGFNFAPANWMLCNGQLLPISQYTALFSVLGTTYGGNGTTNFALPNLQGQIPMHWGTGPTTTVIGEVQGQSNVTLNVQQLPQHTHTAVAAVLGSAGEENAVPTNTSFLSNATSGDHAYTLSPSSITAQFSPKAISLMGSSLPHDNMQPYLVLNFCICINGYFPPHG